MVLMIIFGVIIISVVIIYLFFARKQSLPLKEIICEIQKLPNCDEQLLHLVEHSIRKVNGWNTITAGYTIFHYVFNTISISFSCISIFCSFYENDLNANIASFISLIAISLNLFLRCDRKWVIFHNTLADARLLTFNYIVEAKTASDLTTLTKEYNERIIKLEKYLKVSDIS